MIHKFKIVEPSGEVLAELTKEDGEGSESVAAQPNAADQRWSQVWRGRPRLTQTSAGELDRWAALRAG